MRKFSWRWLGYLFGLSTVYGATMAIAGIDPPIYVPIVWGACISVAMQARD